MGRAYLLMARFNSRAPHFSDRRWLFRNLRGFYGLDTEAL